MESDGTGLFHVVPDEGGDHGPVLQVGHVDGVGPRVGPVEVVVDPVHSQPVSRHHVVAGNHHLLLATFVDWSPVYVMVIL